mmetsp:Transcript_92945/g.113841  ORF Transcript_92945/g.113841 Transcript_92945/m.113841 type:complete len:112 (-) Transcript_92945:40-375(-)
MVSPWELVTGECKVDAAGCITSPDYSPQTAATYPNFKGCTFDVKHKMAMEVEDFNVEFGYDFLIVNGEKFSGTTTPHGKVPEENSVIEWTSDYSVTMSGFKVCPRALTPCD